MIILGVDPGKTGGCVFLHKDTDIIDTQSGIDAAELVWRIEEARKIDLVIAFVEKAQCFPKNGAVGMFNYGTGYGMLLGVLTALKVPFTLVTPGTWTKVMLAGIPKSKKPKDRCLQAFNQLFPLVNFRATKRCVKHDEGLVDALLIAEYGRRLSHLQTLS